MRNEVHGVALKSRVCGGVRPSALSIAVLRGGRLGGDVMQGGAHLLSLAQSGCCLFPRVTAA